MSYVAVCTNASAASRARCASVKPLPATASITSGYAAGEVTTATLGWFFAAPRTIDGPPMSICSTHSSGVAPEATVAANGYRFTTTSWNGSMPSTSSWDR